MLLGKSSGQRLWAKLGFFYRVKLENTMGRAFLASMVWGVHLLVVAFVVLTPFVSRDPLLDLLHVVFVSGMLLHWHFGVDFCALTFAEAKLRGIEMSEGFIHSLVSPVYRFPLDHRAESRLIHATTLGLLAKSLKNLVAHWQSRRR
jgi:hypothetical protein